MSPGPGLDWVYEEVRWWQQWLLGVDTGIMNEPMLRAYMPYTTPWEVYPQDIPGRWVAESVWPPARPAPAVWYLNPSGKLSPRAAGPESIHYLGDKIVGLDKLQWLPFPPAGMPAEQSADDAKSLLFDSPPLDSEVEILGHPVAKIRVAANVPVAKLVVRLTDVTPEGRSWLVSYGLLNLTHRDSHEFPSALEPGKFYDVEIKLFMAAHRFKRGHRIRIAVCESLWPLVWPSPQTATLTIELGTSSIALPVRPPLKSEAPFPIPIVASAPQAMAGLLGAPPEDSVHRGPDGRVSVRREFPEAPHVVAEIGTALIRGGTESNEIIEGAPNSCVWKQENIVGYKRGGWDCRIVAAYELTSTAEAFLVKESLRATKGGEIFFQQETTSKIERHLI